MFGVNDYYIQLLNEAKSPEEIKQILSYQFVQGKGVPQEVLDGVFDIDPTKKKTYTRWVLGQWDKDSEKIENALDSGSLKNMFDCFKERAGSGLDLTAMKSFDDAMRMLPDFDPILKKDGNPDAPENDFEIVYKSDEWIIAVPHCYLADKKLGQGCRWCTAGAFGDNDSYWRQYSKYGPLFVNFDLRDGEICPMDRKKYPYKRYQFCFEFNNFRGEMKDCNDRDIQFDEDYVPEGVLKFYEEEDERYLQTLNNRIGEDAYDEDEAYDNWIDERYDMTHTLKDNDDKYLSLMPSMDSHDDRWNMVEDPTYYLYDEERDTTDPISYTPYNPDDCVVNSFDNLPCILLKDTTGGTHFCYLCVTSERGVWRGRYWEQIDYPIVEYSNGYVILLQNEEIDVFDEEGICMSEQIDIDSPDRMFFPNIDSSDIHGYDNGFWVELVNEMGQHELIYVDFDGMEIIPIVHNDVPENGEYFEIKFDEEDNAYIDGKSLRYSLSEDDQNKYQVEEKLDSYYDDKYLVIATGNHSLRNIYDTSNKRFLLDKPVPRIAPLFKGVCKIGDTINDGILDQEYLYCYDTGKKLTRVYNKIAFTNYNIKNLFGGYINDELYIIRLDEKTLNCKTFGPFINYATTFSEDRILVRTKEDVLNVLDTTTGKLLYNGHAEKYGTFDTRNKYVILGDDNNLSVVNVNTGEAVANNLGKYKPECVFGNQNVRIFKIRMADGKFNFLCNDNLIFNDGFDSCNTPYITGFPLVKKDNKYYVIDLDSLVSGERNTSILPTQYGIDGTYIKNFQPYAGGSYVIDFSKNEQDCNLRIYYDPRDNKIINIVSNIDGQDAERITQELLFPQSQVIREQFYKTLNKIKK